jgi:hypothetical protein
MALVAPVLVVLLLGAGQVGEVAYSMVSIDTAAREGARAGVAAPNAALAWDLAGGGVVPANHDCTATDFTAGSLGNPICIAVVNASGFLRASAYTNNPCAAGQACVTISVVGASNLSDVLLPSSVRLASAAGSLPAAASSCNNGNQATVSGNVSGIPGGATATITDPTGDSQTTSGTGAFTMCVKAGGTVTSQTLTATVPGACGGYTGSVGPFSVTPGGTYTANITVATMGATVSGAVSGIPAGGVAEVTDTTGDTTSTSPSNGSYSMCVGASGGTQTLSARVSTSCGTYTGSSGSFSVTPGGSYTQNFGVVQQPYATVTGTVSGIPSGQSATVKATTGEEVSNITTTYTLCVTAGGSTTSQTLTAQVGPASCGGYTGSVGPFSVATGGTYTENITVTAEGSCPPPSGGGGPPTSCPSTTVSNEYSDYITVTVRYPVGIFVPFIGAVFQSQPGIRMISTSVTYAIEPCTMTQGA